VSSDGENTEGKQQQTFIMCARCKKYIVKSEHNYLAGCDNTQPDINCCDILKEPVSSVFRIGNIFIISLRQNIPPNNREVPTGQLNKTNLKKKILMRPHKITASKCIT